MGPEWHWLGLELMRVCLCSPRHTALLEYSICACVHLDMYSVPAQCVLHLIGNISSGAAGPWSTDPQRKAAARTNSEGAQRRSPSGIGLGCGSCVCVYVYRDTLHCYSTVFVFVFTLMRIVCSLSACYIELGTYFKSSNAYPRALQAPGVQISSVK